MPLMILSVCQSVPLSVSESSTVFEKVVPTRLSNSGTNHAKVITSTAVYTIIGNSTYFFLSVLQLNISEMMNSIKVTGCTACQKMPLFSLCSPWKAVKDAGIAAKAFGQTTACS